MSLHKLTVRFIEYNLWANERQTSWLKTLDRNILYQETGSSFGTIDRTLQHIQAGQLYWYDIIVNNKINDFDQPQKEGAVIEDLINSSKKLIESISAFDETHLSENIHASDSTQSRYEYILHLVNHASYHRGQIVTMARALGVKGEIPVTDYDAYLWWLENM